MSDTVQKIKERLDIIDVISPYTELHKAGKNFKGKSPFSPEKTPSFYVSPDQGLYYCFSTNQGGDMFSFIQAIEGIDFKEALKLLAEKAGVEIVAEDPKKRSAREQQFTILEEATKYYVSQLSGEKDAMQYLHERGVTEETIITWRLGYAPGPPQHGWRHAREHLRARSFNDQELIATGLIKPVVGGKEPYDVFRDRIMFPMANPAGKIVAFSGRLLHKNDDAPKYVNSPETELYKKSELLFGYDRAKDGIRKLDFLLIVEGQFDVIMCHQAGYTNAVAVSGTALTPQHIRLIERLSSNVLLALDADRAGISAIKRAGELMIARGMDVKVTHMEDGKDPADIIKADKTKFRSIVGSASHIVEFLLNHLEHQTPEERTFKLHARREIIPLIAAIPNRIDQEHFVGIFAARLNTTKDAVLYEVKEVAQKNESARRTLPNNATTADHVKKPPLEISRTEDIANYLLAASSVIGQDGEELLKKLELVLNTTKSELEKSVLPEQLSPHVFAATKFYESEPRKVVLADLKHKLLYLETLFLKEQIQTLRLKLTKAEESKDEAEVNRLTQELYSCQQKLSGQKVGDDLYASEGLD